MNTPLIRLRSVTTLTIASMVLLCAGCDNNRAQKVAEDKTKQTKSSPSRQKVALPTGISADGQLSSTGPIEPPNNTQAKKIDRGPPKGQPAAKVVEVAKNVFLEIDGDTRRVLINADVCLRQGMLEQLLCKAMTKEHESILSSDVDAKNIHAALIMAQAEPGSPVRFQNRYTLDNGTVTRVSLQTKMPFIWGFSIYPAHGTVIKVFVQYEEKGKTVKVPAQQWMKSIKTDKELAQNWVFGGSVFYDHPTNPKAPQQYAANEGTVICVANFETAMLDLPIASSKEEQDQDFEAWTDRIPALDTPVVVILEPVLPSKK